MEKYILELFIFGNTIRSERALKNLRRICENELKGQYDLTVIDLLKHPDAVAAEQIIATPTLIKKQPLPVERIIGDLSNKERVLERLDIERWK